MNETRHVGDCGVWGGLEKMSKDVGMVIRKSGVVPTLFGCFFGIPSLHVLSFLKCFSCTLSLLFFGRRRVWMVV